MHKKANFSVAQHWGEQQSKFGGMQVSDAKKLKSPESENAKLKKLLADQMLDNAALKELLAKEW